MKQFLVKVIIFFSLVAFVDFVAGMVFNYLSVHSKGGMTQRDNFICDKLITDVLLCGSSRCVHHYNPAIISDTLGSTCYNIGQNGNGVILLYGRLQMIRSRYEPKMIIYDITPSFDLLLGEDNHRYLTWLKPHYNHKGIPGIFQSVDKTEKYKMLSHMYRFNSHFIELVVDYFYSRNQSNDNGFVPIHKEMDKSKIRDQKETNYEYDPLKLDYLKMLVDEVGDKLVFVVSPIWYGMNTAELRPIIDLCKKNHIRFIDFSNNAKYVHNDMFFSNGSHLNDRGADEFTKDLMAELKKPKM